MLELRGRRLDLARPLVMGIVNLNDDSFSDPGPRTDAGVAALVAAQVAAGADLVDLGAQTADYRRPLTDPAVECELVVRALEQARKAHPDLMLSVDTFKLEVAEAALAAGCHLVNDVSGLAEVALAEASGRVGAGLVVTHTPVGPMVGLQDEDAYGDVVAEVTTWIAGRLGLAIEAGASPGGLVVDPGLDLAKTPGQTIALLRGLGAVAALGRPLLLALSRKDFVGALTLRPPADRGAGTLGAVAAVRHVGPQVLRVHDVAATRDFLAVLDALEGTGPLPQPLVVPDDLRREPEARSPEQ